MHKLAAISIYCLILILPISTPLVYIIWLYGGDQAMNITAASLICSILLFSTIILFYKNLRR